MNCPDCKDTANCPEKLPSSCVTYTGKVSALVKNILPCDPTVTDVIEKAYKLLEDIKNSLGDNRLLDKKCLTFNPLIVKQSELNQIYNNKLCELATDLANVADNITLDAINVTMEINLLCIESGLCDPQTTYTLADILRKMVTKICNHEDRLVVIETLLGI